MLKKTVHSTYIYNAHGHALSGHITRPLDHVIEVQAGMSLPTTGGIGQVRVDNYRFKDYVSFTAGYTHVAGSQSGGETYTTLATATIENLNVLDVVTADRVVARLASTHKYPDPEPEITILGSKIENLRIAGCPVHLEFANELFRRLTTFKAITNEFKSNAKFRKIAADPFLTGNPQKAIDTHGVLVCSFVKDMTVDCPGVEQKGHAFEVPEFGRVFVGEVLAQHRKRTVTMLRFELGCPFVGCVTASQVVGNGHHLP